MFRCGLLASQIFQLALNPFLSGISYWLIVCLPYCSDYHFLKPAPPAVSFTSRWCLSCLEGIAWSCWHPVNQPLGILHLYIYVCSKCRYFCDLTISLGMALDYTIFRFFIYSNSLVICLGKNVLFRNFILKNSTKLYFVSLHHNL